MLTQIISSLTTFIINVISSGGYFGLGALMAVESAAIPLPSEVIMPFAGFLVTQGRFTLLGVAITGGVGSSIGAVLTYAIGRYGGRPLLEKYGKYILISSRDLEISDRFFKKFGSLSSFIARMLPVVRTFISIPAGIAKVNFLKFMVYSFLGSFIWSLLLAYIGMRLGPAWINLRERFHYLDYVIVALIAIGVIWWIFHHFRQKPDVAAPRQTP